MIRVKSAYIDDEGLVHQLVLVSELLRGDVALVKPSKVVRAFHLYRAPSTTSPATATKKIQSRKVTRVREAATKESRRKSRRLVRS